MWGAGLLGLFTGLNIALIGMGIVLIFKTGKYINFAQAQLGIIPMLLMGKMVISWHINWYPAMILALGLGALICVGAEFLMIRPLAKLGPETVLVATLGLSQVLLGLAYIESLGAPPPKLEADGYPVPFSFSYTIQSATLFAQHILTLIVVPLASFLLWLFLQRTLTGKSIRAAACNPESARLAGLNINRLSMVAWGIAGVLATLGAVLDAPNNPGFDPTSTGPGLMFSALGAAALAGFTSFPQVVASASVLSIIEAIVVHQTSDSTDGTLAVLAAVVLGLLIRFRATLLRQLTGGGSTAQLRPGFRPVFRASPQGRIASFFGPGALIIIALVVLAIWNDNGAQLLRVNDTFIICIVAASVSLLGGLTGQLSLGQYAFVGVGAAFTGHFVLHDTNSLLVNILLAAVITGAIAVLVSLPSARGGALLTAVTTLGFGVVATVWFFNLPFFSAQAGETVALQTGPQKFPGYGGISTSRAIYVALLIGTVILVVLGRVLQRSRIGIKMAAARFSEGGARSIGINVMLVRLLAVGACGALAGAAGALDVMQSQGYNPAQYNPQVSLVLISIVIIGGLGSVTGAVFVSVLIYGVPLFLTHIIQDLGGNATQIQLLLGGGSLVINLLFNPGGLSSVMGQTVERFFRKRGGKHGAAAEAVPSGALGGVELDADRAVPVRTPSFEHPALVTANVSRSFGVVKALSDVSITVGEHEIVGLIGNNGAGKTTLLNCIAGDLTSEGSITILGRDVKGMSPRRRANLGLGRTFQDAGLFAGLTTREVVDMATRTAAARAAERGDTAETKESARARADEVMGELGLVPYSNALTSELPTGVRRLVELAVQLARRPRLILLDEPAAGLSQTEVEKFGPLLKSIVARLGCSVLMIEHDLPLMLSIADRIYCLELGSVIAEGTPDEIRTNDAVIESYFGSPEGVGAQRSGAINPTTVV